MARPRPTEIKLVANLLDPEGSASESASELALEIIEALDTARGKRDSYILIAQLARWAPVQAWGEFNTQLQAEKFVKHLSAVDIESDGGRALIVHLEQPDKLLERIGELKK